MRTRTQPGRAEDIIAILAGVYSFYRADLSEFHARTWLRGLSAYDLDQIQEAFDRHVSDPEVGQYLPKPADIYRHLQGTHGDRALVAWGKVFEAIQHVGAYQTVIFDDPVIHATIDDLGGWVQINQITNDELPFLQRRFTDTYRAYSRRGDVKHLPQLTGITEATNRLGGFPVPPPVLIGDPDKAREVQRLGVARPKTTPALAHHVQRLRLTGEGAQ